MFAAQESQHDRLKIESILHGNFNIQYRIIDLLNILPQGDNEGWTIWFVRRI